VASSKSPEAAVEDGKGPTASARCTIVAPGPAARPCRVPGLPAALVEVMLNDLPPLPATAAAPGRFGIRLRRVEDGWRPEGPIGIQPYQGRAPRPARAGSSALLGCCAGSAAVRAGVRFALRAHICRLVPSGSIAGVPAQRRSGREAGRVRFLERGRWDAGVR
jgi:hypothetical protein